jgi:hypothetical protein
MVRHSYQRILQLESSCQRRGLNQCKVLRVNARRLLGLLAQATQLSMSKHYEAEYEDEDEAVFMQPKYSANDSSAIS